MIVIFEQMAILVAFSVVGFLLSRTKLIHSEHTHILSAMGVYVFLPATTFRSFASNFTVAYLKEKYYIVLLSVAILVVLEVVFRFAVKPLTRDAYKRALYQYSLMISNYAYMGYALAGALFGETMLLNIMMFCMPLSVYVHTVAYYRLTGGKISAKKIIDPSLVAIFLGVLVGVSGISVPQVLSDMIAKAAACTAPVSMLMSGMVIAQFGMSKMLKNRNTYVVVALRLLIVPALLSIVLRPFCPEDVVRTAVIVYCLPCGLNTVVFPKLIGEDCEAGASLLVVSNLLSLITIPLCMTFLF